MIKRLRLEYPILTLCRILTVSVSGYYSWSTRKLSRRAQEDQRLEIEIQAAHKRTRKTYNSERLQEDLAEHGIKSRNSPYQAHTQEAWNKVYIK